MTVILLIAGTVSVMTFPSFYYSSKDRAAEEVPVITELGISSKKENLSCVDAYKLMNSNNKMETLLSSDFMDQDYIIELTQEAVENLISGYNENSYFCFVLDYFVSNMKYLIISYSGGSVVGEINGESASVTYVDINIMNQTEFAESAYNIYLRIDYNTKKIYNIIIQGTDIFGALYWDYFDNELGNEEREEAEKHNDIHELTEYMADYWSVPSSWVYCQDESLVLFNLYFFVDEYSEEYEYEYEETIEDNGLIGLHTKNY